MDSPPKLAGETLIVHHIPLVHCQVSGARHCCSPLKRSNPFSCPENLGLSRTTSLPERDVLQREALLYSSLIQTSSSSLSSSQTEGGGGGDGGGGGGGMASDTSSFTSSNSEEPLQSARQVLPNLKPRGRANPLRHNPFLLNTEEEEGEEDEDDDDEDNLNGYLEDSSFHLHGNTHMGLGEGTHLTPFHLHELGFDPEEPFLLHRALEKPWCSSSTGHQGATVSRDGSRGGAFDFSARLESLDLLGLDGGQRRHGSSGSTLSMDCGEQDWGEEEEDEDHGRGSRAGSSGCSSSAAGPRCSCCDFSQPYPEPFSESQLGYGSDSSCNSSDGVLVNFSTIYNKMNNGGPAKPQINLNSSTQHSCSSSTSEPVVGTGGAENGDGGAFYLDLHTSPTEPTSQPLVSQETTDPTSSCGCPSKPQGTVEMDANCNSYHNHLSSEVLVPSDGSVNDLTSCLQSQARLVVATQNYYKLVTCDLSSQSSPSPAGSSVTSSSDEHSKGSPTQPTEYYLFRQPEEGDLEEGDEEDTELSQSEEKTDQCSDESDATLNVIEGQVYVNISPPMASRNVGGSSGGHQRSRSYDRNLDKSPTPRLGSLERMLSCPVRLSEGVSPGPPAPPRVTSFAEIARNKRKTGGSPSLRGGMEASTHSHSSGDFSPIPELHLGGESKSLPPLARSYSHGSCKQNGPLQESPGATHREGRTKAEGGLSCSSNGSPVVVRYSKDKRPTTLPIQPFTFQHQFGKAQSKPLLPLLNDYISHMQGRGGVAPEGGEEDPDEDHRRPPANADAPSTTRPSPLGSYSPVRLHGAPSSGTCSTCTPSPDHGPPGGPRPPRSLSCPLSAGLMPLCTPPGARPVPDSQPKLAPLPPTPPPAPLAKGSPLVPVRPSRCFHGDGLASLPGAGLGPLGPVDSDIRHQTVNAAMQTAVAARQPNVHHLSPQALRWREYRRKNPLGLDRTPTGPLSGNLETRRGGPGHVTRRNVFDFPPSNPALGRLNGQSMRQLQQCYSDFLPDFFSQTELPPEEFCLSPDASSDDSISVDLLQKRGLVKAINKAVDLIVIHFGTSRDPGVKAKLGNSSVSPNIGHLILKYLCPAIREVLQDGLKAYVLDLIIGQRRNQPWSIVDASTQLGPSTRVLHSLYTKVCQYSELTNHSMRLNAFIFGLLNLRSMEFWFNHIYTHEDIVAAHYHPWGFLPLSQGPCQPLFEELLLLLQPLSLLPFDLDLLFEPHLLHEGQEHLRRKEQLCSAGQGLDQSARSTFQLMKGWGTIVAESKREEAGSKTDGAGLPTERFSLRREGTWHRMEGAASKRGVVEQSREGSGSESLVGSNGRPRNGNAGDIERGHRSTERAKGVGGECQIEREEGEREGRRDRDSTSQAVGGARQRSRQAGWWYQLMQSSQVYIDNSTEGSKFVKWEKRKKLSMEGHRQSLPPPREGVVEGAEASQEVPEQVEQTQSNSSSNSSSRSKSSDGGYLSEPSTTERSRATRGRPSWMGSPPESVLSELKTNEKQPETQRPAQADGSGGGGETPTSGMRWGRLFGAGTTGRTEKAEQRSARTQRSSRLPSGWLSLDGSVLDFVVQTVGAGKILEPTASTNQSQELSPTQEAQEMVSQQSACEVRALCHHIASEAGQLSFQKGDVLRVLGRADADWLHCALGDEQGLVPIVYVTLKEENQGSQGPQ